MADWFVRYRHDWIAESVRIFGFINRCHIMAKFDVSMPQASADIRETMKRFPGLMEYNKRTKRYVRAEHVDEESDIGRS